MTVVQRYVSLLVSLFMVSGCSGADNDSKTLSPFVLDDASGQTIIQADGRISHRDQSGSFEQLEEATALNSVYNMNVSQEQAAITEAGKGNADSALKLYMFNELGRDKPNRPEAFRWLRRAAELGNPTAQYNLGSYYEYGLTNKDRIANRELALSWYKKAAAQGDDAAVKAIERLSQDKK